VREAKRCSTHLATHFNNMDGSERHRRLNRSYWLRHHVHVCAVRDGVIFLDAERGRYRALSGSHMHALATVVEGWPASPELGAAVPSDEVAAMRIADAYVDEGLLTRQASQGRSATPPALAVDAVTTAVGADVRRPCSIAIADVINFVRACVLSAVALQHHSMKVILEAALMRKQQGVSAGEQVGEERLIELVCTFRTLRSRSFSARGQCLFHALALLEFLSRYQCYPTWVIGVRTDPWAAHSWVQQGCYVLDGTPESVRFFTPIVVI
jgi:hypothetical protein